MIGKYVITRSDLAGVMAGYLESKDGEEVVLTQVRRIWYWEGAASISELASRGTSKPEKCKFPREVKRVLITHVCEIDECTEKARLNIAAVPVWSA